MCLNRLLFSHLERIIMKVAATRHQRNVETKTTFLRVDHRMCLYRLSFSHLEHITRRVTATRHRRDVVTKTTRFHCWRVTATATVRQKRSGSRARRSRTWFCQTIRRFQSPDGAGSIGKISKRMSVGPFLNLLQMLWCITYVVLLTSVIVVVVSPFPPLTVL